MHGSIFSPYLSVSKLLLTKNFLLKFCVSLRGKTDGWAVRWAYKEIQIKGHW